MAEATADLKNSMAVGEKEKNKSRSSKVVLLLGQIDVQW